MKITFLIICAVTFISTAKGQIGGKHAFAFVNLPTNSHVAGVGGVNVTIPEINFIFQNPALLSPAQSKILSLSYMPFFADIKNSSAAYVHNLRENLPLGIGVQYFSSGQMLQTDEAGNELGAFSANQYFVTGATSHKISAFTLGAAVKIAGSQIGTYSAYAVMADLGGIFKHPSRDFTVGLTVRNAGFAFKKYTSEGAVNVPFDVQVGTSYKLEHMPFRFSITAHHLHQFDIVYLDPNAKGTLDDQGNEIKQKKSFGDKLARHFVVGGEFFLGKSLSLLFGYNYQRRQELKAETKSAVAGFSFGGSIKIKSFNLIYSRAFYQPIGGANFITLNTTLSTLFKKKSITPEYSPGKTL